MLLAACLSFGLSAGPARAADTHEDFYWNAKSYGRGVGTIPPGTCGSKEDDAGLCYDKCRPGYHGEDPVCWEDKPESPSYPRGAGTVPHVVWSHFKLEERCSGDRENSNGLCYEKCRPDYHGVGPVCWNSKALSYGRGAGVVPKLVCKAGQDLNAGLCYESCREGYAGVGPVCWGKAPPAYMVCGAGFARNQSECMSIVQAQAGSVVALFSAALTPEVEEVRKARQKKLSTKQKQAATDLVKTLQPFVDETKKTLAPLKDLSKPAGNVIADLRAAWKKFDGEDMHKTLKTILTAADMGHANYSGPGADIDILRDVSRLVSELPIGDDPAANAVQDVFGVMAAYMYPGYGQ